MTDRAYTVNRTNKDKSDPGAADLLSEVHLLLTRDAMDTTMNSEECAAFLHIHENTLMSLIATGEIPTTKVGKGWVFLKSQIVDYLKDRIRESTAARRASKQVEDSLDAAEQRSERSITPTVRQSRAPSRRKVPPTLPDLPSPEFVRQLACT